MSREKRKLDLSKTEFWVAIAGLVGAICTAVLTSGLVLEGTTAYVLLTIGVTVATYIAGRSWVKAAEAKSRRPNTFVVRPPPSDAASIRTSAPSPGE